jgi:hypothetical protein
MKFSAAMGWLGKIKLLSAAMVRSAKITGYFWWPNKSCLKIRLCSTVFFPLAVKILSRRKLSNILVTRAWISLSLLHATCPFPTLSNAQISAPAAALGHAPLPMPSRLGVRSRCTAPHPTPMPAPFDRSRAVPGHLRATARPSFATACVCAPPPPQSNPPRT